MNALYPFSCILLSGMPCTGKDTISQQLVNRDPAFAFFRKHRAVSSAFVQGDSYTYIDISPEAFQSLVETGGFFQFHSRYGNKYGVAKAEYDVLQQAQKIPIIHVGKYENLLTLRRSKLQDAFSVLLWADRAVIRSRLEQRHKNRADGIDERLVAYDQEIEQLKHYSAEGSLDFDLVYENNGDNSVTATEEVLTLLRTPFSWSKSTAQTSLLQLLDRAY